LLAAADTVGPEVKILHAATEGEIDAVFASLAQARIGAVLVPADALFNSRITQIIALAARYAVLTVCAIREFPLAGGLISYGYSLTEAYRLAGLHVARILNGEKPADLPVLQAAKIGLVINLKTAKALSLTVPPTLLARAEALKRVRGDWLLISPIAPGPRDHLIG
jgi:putative ABC transport system substrate-binding protein